MRLEQPRVHSSAVWDTEPMLHPNLTKIRPLSLAREKRINVLKMGQNPLPLGLAVPLSSADLEQIRENPCNN